MYCDENDEFLNDETPSYNYDNCEYAIDQSSRRRRSSEDPNHSGIAIGKTPNFSSNNIPKSSGRDITSARFGDTVESDPVRIASREKQVLFGKNTTGYDNYLAAIPK